MTRANALRLCALLAAIGAVAAYARSRNGGDSAATAEGEGARVVMDAAPSGLAPAPRREADGGATRRNGPEASSPPGLNPKTSEALDRVRTLDAAVSGQAKAVEAISSAIEALHDPDEAVRAAAARVLAAAGRPAVQPLIAAVRKDIAAAGGAWSRFPGAAMVAFDGLAEQGADLLAQTLGEAQLDLWAASTLGRAASLRKDVRAALPNIRALLRGEDERARQWAAQAAPSTGRAAEGAVPDLARCLQSADVQTRIEAVQALGRIGPPASSALSDLRALMSDPNDTVRRLAAEAAAHIEGR